MKDSTKAIILAGGLVGAAYLLLTMRKAEAAAPLKLVSYDVPDSIVAGDILYFSVVVKSEQTQDVTFYGHFIKVVGTAYDRADHITVHLEAGQEMGIAFSILMFPPDHWAWQWERAEPSKGLIQVDAHRSDTLENIARWKLREITVYRS